MDNVLITGGAGFIGSNVALALADDYNVTVVDNEYLGTSDYLDDKVTFVKQSVTEDIPSDVDILFHFAALSSYEMHEHDPVKGAHVNVTGFVNTVNQVMQDGCDTVVYASTSSIHPSYDDYGYINSGYEASKISREKYAEYFSNHYDMNMAGLRYFSVYQGFNKQELHKGQYANVISQFVDSMVDDNQPVVYGDGTQTRDFIHIDDAVQATIKLAENKLDGVYDIATGTSYTFNTIIDMINQELGKDIEPDYIDNPIPENVYVERHNADSHRLERLIDWSPQISIEDGIQRVCDQYT